MKLKLDKNYYCIVDTSYLIFYTASSAFKQYVFQEDIMDSTLGPDFDPTLDQEYNIIFMEKFKQRIENALKKYFSLFYKSVNIIFALDCPRNDIWRREIYPEYKLNRDLQDHLKDKFNIGKIFNYAYSTLIPNFSDEHNALVIKSTTAEADDIVAVLCRYILKKDKNADILILSSDRDMVQLYSDNISIMTCDNEVREPKKEFLQLTKLDDIENEISPADFTLFKILIGDSSDNIPAVKMRMGPKTAMKYVLDKSRESLKQLFSEDINIAKSFKRNRQLISMKEIPDYVSDLIVENIEEAFEKQKNSQPRQKHEVEEYDDLFN